MLAEPADQTGHSALCATIQLRLRQSCKALGKYQQILFCEGESPVGEETLEGLLCVIKSERIPPLPVDRLTNLAESTLASCSFASPSELLCHQGGWVARTLQKKSSQW
jgi:hypothetical protein